MTGYAFQLAILYAIGSYTRCPYSWQSCHQKGLGVLCVRPDRGLMVILASPNVGGVVARRLLPMGVGFPFLLALAYLGQAVRLNKTQFGGFILLFLGILMFTAPILWTATLLYRTYEVERAERHLAAQYAVAQILVESGPVHEIAQPTLQAICSHLGWDHGAIWEVNSEGSGLTAVAVFNRLPEAEKNSPAEQAWTRGQSIWSERGAAFPIIMKGEVIGVIECSEEGRLVSATKF